MSPLKHLLLATLLLVGVAIMIEAVILLPPEAEGLQPTVSTHLGESGVSNPVTAVLLNFRGYDTLLEILVLATALWAVLAVGGTAIVPRPQPTNSLLAALTACLVPILVLVAAYLLWIGASRPGGAFQAAALLTAGALLLDLSGYNPIRRLSVWWLRLLLLIGPAVFLGAALLCLRYGELLTYPAGYAKYWILTIEVACTVSIGFILLLLVLGGRPGEDATTERESVM